MAGEGKFPPSALIAGQEEEKPRFPLPLPRARARERDREKERERGKRLPLRTRNYLSV